MAQQPLLLLTSVDVRRLTEGDLSRATTISKLTIPTIRFQSSEHNPGGGVMAANFAQPRIEALEPAFMVKGLDPDVFRGLGLRDIWTFAATMKNQQTGTNTPVRGIIEGAVTTFEPDETDPAEFQGCNHSITEVVHFELRLGDRELFYVDMFERIIRRDGVDLFADTRRALGA